MEWWLKTYIKLHDRNVKGDCDTHPVMLDLSFKMYTHFHEH